MSRHQSWLLFLSVAAFSTGCVSTLAAVSSGQVGCPESEIEILDHSPGLVCTTWVAACRGQRFFCSSLSGTHSIQVSCSPQQRPMMANAYRTASSPTGCQHDGQCKGDRICQSGRCVDPHPDKATAAKLPSSPAKEETRPRTFAERKAECENGNSDLCVTLAKLIEDGQETPADRTRPADLYEIACRGGSNAGCLGLMRAKK